MESVANFTHHKLTHEQQTEMDQFLTTKKEIQKHGEFKDGQFDRLAELGYGNGGVVLQVKHKPTETIMARKVRKCHTAF